MVRLGYGRYSSWYDSEELLDVDNMTEAELTMRLLASSS